MQEKRKDKQEELSPEEKAEAAHRRNTENAKRLERAISLITLQAEEEAKVRKDRQGANLPQNPATIPNDPPIVTAAIQFGYDAPGGGLKAAVSQLREAAKALDSKEQKGSSPTQLVDKLEEDLRDLQDGWMLGNPVDPNAAKRLVSSLGDELKGRNGADPNKVKIVNQQLTDFSTKIDNEVERLQKKATERADSNASFRAYRDLVRQEVFSRKLTSQISGVHEGPCAFVQLAGKPDQAAIQGVLFPNGARRGYVYVGGSLPPADEQAAENNKLYYVNQNLGTITPINLTKGQQERLAEGGRRYYEYEIFKGYFSIDVAEMLPLGVAPVELPKGEGPANGLILGYGQEQLMREITSHSPGQRRFDDKELHDSELKKSGLFVRKEDSESNLLDWKNILPVAFGDRAAEIAQRNKDEADFESKGVDKELAAQMALDKAIERLEQHKDEEVTFNYMKDLQFNIIRKKDDEGKTVFRVHYDNHHDPKNLPAAMKAMIERCHEHDPNAEVFLSCTPLSELRYGGERVVKRYSDRMIKQLEQAVIAAENAHRRGIYTGLEVDQSLKEVISSNSSKRQLALVDDLMERVGRLHKEWVEKVEEPNQKKEQQAVARFGESKTGDLGVLLARSPEQAGGADIKSIAQELQGALKTKADATIDAQVLSERKVSELKREMQKVENKYQQLMITSHSVADHLKDTEKKIEECKDDIPRLSEHIEKLEALKMAQVQVNKEAKSLAEIAGNHERWFERLDGQEMKSVLDIKPADKILLSDTMKDITKAAGELPTKSSAVGGNLTEIQRHLDKAKEYRRQAELKAGAANANAPPHDAKHRPGLP